MREPAFSVSNYCTIFLMLEVYFCCWKKPDNVGCNESESLNDLVIDM